MSHKSFSQSSLSQTHESLNNNKKLNFDKFSQNDIYENHQYFDPNTYSYEELDNEADIILSILSEIMLLEANIRSEIIEIEKK